MKVYFKQGKKIIAGEVVGIVVNIDGAQKTIDGDKVVAFEKGIE